MAEERNLHVVCYSTLADDEACCTFGPALYKALKEGKDYETAFKHAVNTLRVQVRRQDTVPRFKIADPRLEPTATRGRPRAAGIPALLLPCGHKVCGCGSRTGCTHLAFTASD